MQEKKEIQMISVSQIYPHPDNPRKNLGDLTELSESLKKNGVMQNLTLIPLSALDQEPDKQPSADEISLLSDFHVIIGHRRLAAAKKAGLTELPCRIVSKISKKEQVSIMLEENMQRNDLTIFEQAQGFQMMLDLGETEDTIAEKTGFSKSTIRHRLHIAKLDPKLLKKVEKDESFQLSLKDLYELEKIKNVDTRNEVLKNAYNSRDLVSKARSAVEEEKRQNFMDKLIPMLEKAGIKKAPKKVESEQWSGKWDKLKDYSLNGSLPEKISVQHKKTDELLYVRWWNSIYIIRKASKSKSDSAAEKKQKELDKRRKEINALGKKMVARMKDYIRLIITGAISPVKESEELRMEILRISIAYGTRVWNSSLISTLLCKEFYQCSDEEKEKAQKQLSELNFINTLLLVLCSSIDSNPDVCDYYGKVNETIVSRIKQVCALLERYGYVIEEEELQILDGTHELYVKEDK